MDAPTVPNSRRVLLAAGGVAVLTLILIEILGSVGQVLHTGMSSAAMRVAGRAGLGLLILTLWAAPGTLLATALTRRLPAFTDLPLLRLALGIAFGFTLSHAIGWAGGFGPSLRLITTLAWLACAAYAIFRASQYAQKLLRERSLGERIAAIHPLHLISIPAVAVLLLAASQPPGWLWGSEYGAFDSLSYHLQLPQEWLANGRLAPVPHNVYSYLPSSMEALFMQIGAAAESLEHLTTGSAEPGLLSWGGEPLLACQMLHAFMAILAAAIAGRTVTALCGSAAGGACAFLIVLTTPWVVVTGSLSYNECAVLALFAAAMLAAIHPLLEVRRATVIAAILIGAACGCKPTALLFCAAPVGLTLLSRTSRSALVQVLGLGAVVGLAMLGPWLLRNFISAHNPVFPELAGVFGNGGWNAEQIARYHAAHHFGGGWGERIGLLLSGDRGVLHRQYGLWAVTLLFPAALLCSRTMRRPAGILLAGIATQVAAWLFLTHLQSRFLIPIVIPTALAAGCIAHAASFRSIGRVVVALLALTQGVWCVVLYVRERPLDPSTPIGSPNLLLHTGSGYYDGRAFEPELRTMTPDQKLKFIQDLPPEPFLHFTEPGDASLLLIGDATPLYFGPVQYATTWDTVPGLNAAQLNSDPGAVLRSLSKRGISRVLVNFAELDRYRTSKFGDPALTPDAVAEFMKRFGEPVKAWPVQSQHPYQVLFKLRPAPAAPGASR